jgi:hypothetical protein
LPARYGAAGVRASLERANREGILALGQPLQ